MKKILTILIISKINFLSSQNESFYKPTSNFESFLSKYDLYPKVNTDGASKMLKNQNKKLYYQCVMAITQSTIYKKSLR